MEFKGAEVCQRRSADFSFLPDLKDRASRKGFPVMEMLDLMVTVLGSSVDALVECSYDARRVE